MKEQTAILNDYYDIADKLIAEVEKVIIGKRTEIDYLITAMLAGGHVLIEDVPGVGKTTLAATLAKAAGLDYNRAQFTPDVMASDITGFNIYNRQKEQFEFRQGLVMCNLLLADEINRASPKTQSSLLEAMEEGRVTVDGTTYPIPKPFMVIATQNPVGYVGTYPLPEAQLDRFSIRLSLGYPSEQEEIQIINARKLQNPLSKVDIAADKQTIMSMRQAISEVQIAPEIYRYIVTLVQATRHHRYVALGASPRASLTLMKLSQAYAFLRRRNYVIPDDVAALYTISLAHRLLLNRDAKLGNVSSDQILREILHRTPVPYKGMQ
ncbi:MAG: MoxR family ATPase [Clostridiales bacterium]|nr:MoxR family ATPase [Clostridiales bacterium]